MSIVETLAAVSVAIGATLGALLTEDWPGAAAIVAVAVAATIVLHGRVVTARLGRIEATVTSVDRAVNHRPPASPTLSEETSTIAEEVAEIRHRIDALAARLDEHLDG